MGNVIEKIKKCVEWVGNIFAKVIKWFRDYMKDVNKKTEKFLNKKQKEADRKINIFLKLFEPAMIIALGITIGFIVVSVLLPIFEINSIVK